MNTKRALATTVILSLVTFASTVCLAETSAPAPAAKAASVTEVTVADAFAKKDALVGKEIAIKGKVVKASSGIMGTNWYHIQDGTGSKGTDDFIVTSHDSAKVGDQVVAKGVLSKDVDFGAGYKYAVIIKDGKVSAK